MDIVNGTKNGILNFYYYCKNKLLRFPLDSPLENRVAYIFSDF